MEGDLKHVSAQNLECSICLNIFDDPKILSCSHTFCKGCLTRLLESQPNASELPCPVCREITNVPSGNTTHLQSNIALRSLIDNVRSQHQLCTNCNLQGANEAIFYCQECGKYLCVPCHQAHSQWRDFSAHQIYSMKDVLSGKVSLKRRRKCQKHPNEDEEYFCSDCRKYVCFRCRMIDKHEREGHAIMEASEHEDIQRKNIEELETKSDEAVAKITEYIEFTEGQRVELREMAKKVDENVVSAYHEAVQQLTERKEFLREEIKGTFACLEQELDATVDTSHQQITNVNAVKELVSGGRKIPLEEEALTTHDSLCEDMKGILKRMNPDHEKARNPIKRGKRISFEQNKGENELNLGRIEGVEWRCRGF